MALRVGVIRMGRGARLTNRNGTVRRKPIRVSDLARQMAELQALRAIVRKAEGRSDSGVRLLARTRTLV